MSNYYEYQDVGVKIAHRLFKLNGWKVYGYHADESDSMTDYYDPAYWRGTAEKNGYTFVFNRSWESKGDSYTKARRTVTNDNAEKIEKLRRMTVERGATVFEEETAKRKIEEIMRKAAETVKESEEVIITELPHMANPGRCNWHIEKDGVIIDKGTGLLKYSSVLDITQDRYLKEWQDFNNLTKEQWIEKRMRDCWRYNLTREQAEMQYKNTAEDVKLLENFNKFINRIDTTCGGMIGKEGQEYKKVKKTVYKKENKAYKTTAGEVKEGQHFILVSSFNYGCTSGSVYRIDYINKDANGKPVSFGAFKLNGKLTKVCTGSANASNRFYVSIDRFENWINKGAISYCEIREENTPYEVEKLVKVKRGA